MSGAAAPAGLSPQPHRRDARRGPIPGLMSHMMANSVLEDWLSPTPRKSSGPPTW